MFDALDNILGEIQDVLLSAAQPAKEPIQTVSGSSYELECLADELQKWVDADESGGRKLVNSFLLDRILAYLKERQT